MEYSQRTFGEEHESTVKAMDMTGDVLRALERPGEALELEERALALARKAFGDAHSTTLTVVVHCVDTLLDLGRASDALALCEPALAQAQAALGADSHLANLLRDRAASCRSARDR